MKDAALWMLITLIKNYDMQHIHDFLGIEHQNTLEEVQSKFVNKTYKSKNFKPEWFELDFNTLKNEASKIRLNFGKLKFKDKSGKRLVGLEVENEEETLVNNYCTLTGSDHDVFISNGDLVFGLIPKILFFESLAFDKDWKVRLYALEDIVKIIRAKNVRTELTQYQQYNLTRYLYLQFTGGSKKGFLADCANQKVTNDSNNTCDPDSTGPPHKKNNFFATHNGFTNPKAHYEVHDTNPTQPPIPPRINSSLNQRQKTLATRTFDKSFKPPPSPSPPSPNPNAILNFHNTPKINILLLLTSEKLLTLESNLLIEPIIALLSNTHPGIRSLAFLFLSNLQKFYSKKCGPLLLTYIEALKVESWHLREEILKLIALLFWENNSEFEYESLRVLKAIAKL